MCFGTALKDGMLLTGSLSFINFAPRAPGI
jgi:hypothetical protein